MGSKFLIQTDHNSLQHLLQQNTLTAEKQKWIKKISTFDIDILHKKGKDNVVADALSRKDEEVQVYAISMVIPKILDEIQTDNAKNAQVCSIIENINQYPKFECKNDLLWYKGRFYLSANSKFKTKVCKESHDCPVAGHVGF